MSKKAIAEPGDAIVCSQSPNASDVRLAHARVFRTDDRREGVPDGGPCTSGGYTAGALLRHKAEVAEQQR
jgi:hypothetical protein